MGKESTVKIDRRQPSALNKCRCGAVLKFWGHEQLSTPNKVWMCCEECHALVDTFDLPSTGRKP